MKKGLIGRIVGIGMVSLSALAVAVASIAWFAMPDKSSEKSLNGEIGLRGYFYDGDGSEEKPFEIVNPIHFYNLCRLQNLGLFPEKKHFQIGHNFDDVLVDPNDPSKGYVGLACINTYEDGEPVYDYFLDMEDMSNSSRILPIGSEGTPFVGNFNGYGMPIKNLKVSGNPEDVGVFGYVSYEGKVEGLVCEDLEVHSLGYTNSPADNSTDLFGRDIDDIFSNASDNITKAMNLTFYDNNAAGTQEDPTATQLKAPNGLKGKYINYINSHGNEINGDIYEKVAYATDGNAKTYSTYYNGYFLPTFPTASDVTTPDGKQFEYRWKTSSSTLKQCTVEHKEAGLDIADSDIKNAIVIDMADLEASSSDSSERGFNCGQDMQVDARLSLIASIDIDGFTYSRVIQSYKVEFYSNSTTYEEGRYSLSIFCDYVDQGVSGDKATNYHHGNNVGFLAGHVDGTITQSYVYKGKLYLNDGTGCQAIKSESESGLIGEIGTNVINMLDPDFNKTVHSDTGVMNFTKIYNNIRRDFTLDDFRTETGVWGGYYDSVGKSYVSYHYQRAATFDLFSDYLRHMNTAEGEYITKVAGTMGYGTGQDRLWHKLIGSQIPSSSVPDSYNSVDFIFNSVIQDEEDKDRGLGVFKIVSTYNEAAIRDGYSSHLYDNMGECYIVNSSIAKSKVYFSTAEYRYKKMNESGQWVDMPTQPAWGRDTGLIDPLMPTTLPSYSTDTSFEYPFSRDYNYLFELDLTQETGGKNYMSNTDSEFLTNYLESVLIDKYGGSIAWGNPRFGFMFRSSENDLLNALSSYMPLGAPGSKRNFGTEQEPLYYPEKSITFKIENENGANVSVVANNADVSIYSFDSSTSSGGTTKICTMMSGNRNSSEPDGTIGNLPEDIDHHRYFTYNALTGETGTESVIYGAGEDETSYMLDNNALYAHIFKLPKGEYAIGSSSGNATANIYFLAVQGQTEGTIGDAEKANVGNAVTDVDFLLAEPTLADYPSTLSAALFSFKSEFNSSVNKVFQVDVKTIDSHKYVSLIFEDNPQYVTYLLTLSREHNHIYYINNVEIDRAQYVVPRN